MAQHRPDHLVQTLTLAADRLEPPVDDATEAAHFARFRRLARMQADGVPDGVAAATYDAYVSALTYVAAYLVEPLYQRLTEHPSEPLTADEQRLLAAAERILQAYSVTGNARAVDPDDPLRRINPDRPSPGPASEGAFRAAARRLARSTRYQDGTFFRRAREETGAPEAIALCLVTGVRNKELAHGVRVGPARNGDQLVALITGAKVSAAHGRGLPYRLLLFDKNRDPATPLGYLSACVDRAGPHTVRLSESGLLRAVKAASRATFRRPLAEVVTPYCLRHLVAGRLRRRARKRTAMAALGHVGPESVYAYYNGDDAGDLPAAVYASELQPGMAPDPGGLTLRV